MTKQELAMKYLIQEVEKHPGWTYRDCEDILHPMICMFNELLSEYKGTKSSFYCTYSDDLIAWFRTNRPNRTYRKVLEYSCAELAACIAYDQYGDGDCPMMAFILGLDYEDPDLDNKIKSILPEGQDEILKYIMLKCIDMYDSMTNEDFLIEAEELQMEVYQLIF